MDVGRGLVVFQRFRLHFHPWIFHLTITPSLASLKLCYPTQRLWRILSDFLSRNFETTLQKSGIIFRQNEDQEGLVLFPITGLIYSWQVWWCIGLSVTSVYPLPTQIKNKIILPSRLPFPCLFPFSLLSPKCHSLTFLFSFFQSFKHHPDPVINYSFWIIIPFCLFTSY